MGADAACPLPAATPNDPAPLLHRRVLVELLRRGGGRHARLWCARVPSAEVRLRAGAASPRLRARTADGGKSPPGPPRQSGQPLGFPGATDLGRAPRLRGAL